MAASNPQRKPDPINKKRDPVTQFREDYENALVDAHVSAAHTETEGWQKLYREHLEFVAEAKRQLASQLEVFGAKLPRAGWDDDDCKDVKGIVESVKELQRVDMVFGLKTVGPVKAPVDTCSEIVSRWREEARRIEREAPLHNAGLVHLMDGAIKSMARPEWKPKTGVVVVGERSWD